MKTGSPTVLFAVPMVALLTLPVLALLMSSHPNALLEGMRHPLFLDAITLSLWTATLSLGVVILLGTPLSLWMARHSNRMSRVLQQMVLVPVVLPPAVVGLALLQAFAPNGFLGSVFAMIGIQVPFTPWAVVLAQTIIAAPFYIQSATVGFRRVDPQFVVVAESLGLTRRETFRRIIVPLALPSLISGAALTWARAMGEFGATLLFAGNLPGTTQTMPLAIYMALETNVRVSIALAIVLAAGCIMVLGLAQWLVPTEKTWSSRKERS